MMMQLAAVVFSMAFVLAACQSQGGGGEPGRGQPAAGGKAPAAAGKEGEKKVGKEAVAGSEEARPAQAATASPRKVGGEAAAKPAAAGPRVRFVTSKGDIVVELTADRTPTTVQNFLDYVDAGFYAGTIFHRVIPGFVVQGGGFSTDFQQKATRAPIKNEAAKAIPNDRGTICMARTGVRDSATSQFYFNLSNNVSLNYRGESAQGWGYAAFGRIVEGLETIDAIAGVKTGPGGPFPQDVPQEMVIIKEVVRLP